MTVPQTLTDMHYFVFGAGCECGKYFEFSDEPKAGVAIGMPKELPT